MDVNQFRYFTMTVRLGSYAATAKNVFMTPPGVSKAIGELEKELGVKLLERAGKTVRPTAYGEALYEKAITILSEVEDMRSMVESMTSCQKCEGPFGMAVSILPYRGAIVRQSVIDALAEAYPKLKLSTFRSSSSVCLAALEEAIVQAAIVMGRVEREWATSVKLFSIKPEIAISQEHPLASLEKVSVEDVLAYPIARPNDLRYCYTAITKALKKSGCNPRYREVFPSDRSHADFMQKENGVVFVARDAYLDPIYAKSVFLKLENFDVSIPVHFVYRSEDTSHLVTLVKNHFLSAFRSRKVASRF